MTVLIIKSKLTKQELWRILDRELPFGEMQDVEIMEVTA